MKRSGLAILLLSAVLLLPMKAWSAGITCWFAPEYKEKAADAQKIVDALSKKSGVAINVRVAASYPEMMGAMSSPDQNLVYVGSFAQALIKARGLGTPLAQAVTGKEHYAGILIYPSGGNPAEILKSSPDKIAYALGASSGESSAKAATGGKAAKAVANHGAAVTAAKEGRAAAAVVKNWWWEANKDKFAGMSDYKIPGISENKNPDNVLTASKAVPADVAAKIKTAAMESADAFGAKSMAAFDAKQLDFSLDLMKKGGINPATYSW
ncbi:MAG TPA: PhnD/SsuA/transferrin family substrate-binding protein [Desulfurivibrionaceae bacterium]|nr:PhnD/SsuA/transferrin family substrate-binding protein [Desulfurivibrionaceae bacterium]